ncbi:hypothetical protein L916_01610 [Phytophthora nicotianae]|uniref:Uncharacterized protein n=1 Tax=Phytophthora nicotianae TaxID=4792 RepID=W2JQX6_PHYNI|nr:hypothetical protein L916_01610 [Phytophthora nicotianae]
MADRSREDRMTRLTSRDKAVKMTMKTFGLKNRPIAKLGTMADTQALKNHDSMKQRPRRRRLQGNDKHLPDAGDRVTHEY